MKQISSITVHPEIQDGAPVFSGTRIRVETFYDYLRIGVSVRDFLSEFPSVTPDQVDEVFDLARQQYTVDQLKALVSGPEARQYTPPTGRVYSSTGSFRP
ncbi:MAG: DUF433 domain-containing protein [Saprospiraceae bacterium]|jgi:uncharacterized protein (DUF433 family)